MIDRVVFYIYVMHFWPGGHIRPVIGCHVACKKRKLVVVVQL